MKTLKGTVAVGLLLVGSWCASGQALPPAAAPSPAARPPGALQPVPAPPRPAVTPNRPGTPARNYQTPPTAAVPSYTPPGVPLAQPQPTTDPNALKFDAELKEHTTKVGDVDAHYTFYVTNVSSSDVLIHNIRTSCGCTAAKLPSQPWTLKPNDSGPISVTLNLSGKSGVINKGVTVETSSGWKSLIIRANITPGGGANPSMGDTERLKNMQLALADRQVVFKNQHCATCHADPARDKTDGRQIYAAACAICHDSHLRAAMVPDLKQLAHPNMDAEYWRNWVKFGKSGSMMPAFAQSEGGPLSDAQIEALVVFLQQAYPGRRLPGTLSNPGASARVQPAGGRTGIVPPPPAVPSAPAR